MRRSPSPASGSQPGIVTAIAWQAAAVMALRIMLSGFLELGGAAPRGVDTVCQPGPRLRKCAAPLFLLVNRNFRSAIFETENGLYLSCLIVP
jgi:hypothetical protein